MTSKKTSLALFQEQHVRRHWDEEQELWFFSVVDVVTILTDSTVPKRYWSDLKKKLQNEGSEVYEKIVQLKMIASDGKMSFGKEFFKTFFQKIILSFRSRKREGNLAWFFEEIPKRRSSLYAWDDNS